MDHIYINFILTINYKEMFWMRAESFEEKITYIYDDPVYFADDLGALLG